MRTRRRQLTRSPRPCSRRSSRSVATRRLTPPKATPWRTRRPMNRKRRSRTQQGPRVRSRKSPRRQFGRRRSASAARRRTKTQWWKPSPSSPRRRRTRLCRTSRPMARRRCPRKRSGRRRSRSAAPSGGRAGRRAVRRRARCRGRDCCRAGLGVESGDGARGVGLEEGGLVQPLPGRPSRSPRCPPTKGLLPRKRLVAENEPVAEVETVVAEPLPKSRLPPRPSRAFSPSPPPNLGTRRRPCRPRLSSKLCAASVPASYAVRSLHPPVAAADLPPLVGEDVAEGPVLEEGALTRRQEGRQARQEAQEQKAPTEEVQPPVVAADLPTLVDEDAPKVPFWKKELSLGGKKGDKPVKEREQEDPAAKT